MRVASATVFLAFLPIPANAHLEAQPITGDDVARRAEARDRGEDGRLRLEMRLYDHRGRETVRRLTVLTRRQDELDSVILRFDYPGDIRDTGFLSREQSGDEDDRYLFLPALGRSRRISSQEKQDSFVGSDFTYEEITGRHLEDYTYRLLGEDSVDGRPVYVLESAAKRPDAKYPRAVSRVDAERFIILRSEIFGRSEERVKDFAAGRVEKVDGVWTALEQTMRSLRDGTHTVLEVLEAKYNLGLPGGAFTRTTLERGGELP